MMQLEALYPKHTELLGGRATGLEEICHALQRVDVSVEEFGVDAAQHSLCLAELCKAATRDLQSKTAAAARRIDVEPTQNSARTFVRPKQQKSTNEQRALAQLPQTMTCSA